MLISLAQYAEMHGKCRRAAARMIERGSLKTAQKIGNAWVVDSDEPYPDHRFKKNAAPAEGSDAPPQDDDGQ